MMNTSGDRLDVAVVGGGLAGLTAAIYLARAGRRVALFERSESPGGRARTEKHGEYLFNLGPHALYRQSAGMQVLRELDVRFEGNPPQTSGGYAIDGDRAHTLPAGFLSLATTGLLRLSGKIELARFLSSLASIDPNPWHDAPLSVWLQQAVHDPVARRLIGALVRVSTYTHAPDMQSAGAGIQQLQMALAAGVLYLDGGWQTLVDGLRRAAERAGTDIVTTARVSAVEHDDSVRGIRLADGTSIPAAAVIVAVGPHEVERLVHPNAARALFGRTGPPVPVKMACLTVALSRLPRPRTLIALGVDRPLYLSVHSAVAKLAPAGGALVHLGHYLEPATPKLAGLRPSGGGRTAPHDAGPYERELETMLDLVQPGWRDAVVARQFLPAMIVSHGLVRASTGGTRGRPGPRASSISGLYLAGDWVGPTGQLADASFASAREAASLALRELAEQPLARSQQEIAV